MHNRLNPRKIRTTTQTQNKKETKPPAPPPQRRMVKKTGKFGNISACRYICLHLSKSHLKSSISCTSCSSCIHMIEKKLKILYYYEFDDKKKRRAFFFFSLSSWLYSFFFVACLYIMMLHGAQNRFLLLLVWERQMCFCGLLLPGRGISSQQQEDYARQRRQHSITRRCYITYIYKS